MRESKGIGRLGEMLHGIAASKNWRARLAQHVLFLCWAKVVGPEIAAVARPEVIRDSVLWVRVIDPVWGQQLQFEQTTMLTAINQRLEVEQKISAIRFRMDPSLEQEVMAEEVGRAGPEQGKSAGARKKRKPDAAKEAEFIRMVSGINDAEARANLLRLWRKAQTG